MYVTTTVGTNPLFTSSLQGFSHFVERGWKPECAESTEFGGGRSPVLDGFDPSGAVPPTGLFGDDAAECPQQSSFEEFAGDVEQNLGG